MIDFVAFGIVIGDIVFPDGRTAMGVLGGGECTSGCTALGRTRTNCRQPKTLTILKVPAVDVVVRDPIGAGNAYCGAFLASWTETTCDLATAGAWSAVAASCIIENVGVPVISVELQHIAQQLYKDLQPHIRAIRNGESF